MKETNYRIISFFLPRKHKLLLLKIRLGYSLVTSEDSYLVETGYVNSRILNSLTNSYNEHIPWINYHLIDFLNQKLNKNLVVFEYGSGFSTIFFPRELKKLFRLNILKSSLKP